ncbi:MAG: hypothetical protein NTV63_05155 [Candidatus Woesearchaeota archaeon]|nr:hypothetical protein [Candidatus Woesearchaeota archaeon]
MHYDYSRQRTLEEVIEETKLRLKQQENFSRDFIPPIMFLYKNILRPIYAEVKSSGLENIEKIKDKKYSIITYNHMFNFDAVEIVYNIMRAGIHPANVSKHEVFFDKNIGDRLLKWLMEGSGSFPVYLVYEEKDGIRSSRGTGELDRLKLDNFFKQFWAYLELEKPVTMAINGSITRERVFPKPENGLAHALIRVPEQIGAKADEIYILPVGNAFIGDLTEYVKILSDHVHYRNFISQTKNGLLKIRKKISLFLKFGEPFTLESVLKNHQEPNGIEQREAISAEIMNRIKNEIRKAWNEFDIEKKYNRSVEDYFKESFFAK